MVNRLKLFISVALALCALQPLLGMESDHNESKDQTIRSEESSYSCDSDSSSDDTDYALFFKDNEESRSPLMNAAFAGDYAACKKLIIDGADINQRTSFADRTALHFAAQAGHASIVKLLLMYGANPYIKHYGEKETELGMCISAKHLARENQFPEIIQIIEQHQEILAALFDACKEGNTDRVASLLRIYKIANVARKAIPLGCRYCTHTPLMIAASHGHAQLCQLLLDYGADQNIHDEEYVCASARSINLIMSAKKVTALTYAQRNGNAETVKVLEEHIHNPFPLKQLLIYELIDQVNAGTMSSANLIKKAPNDVVEEYFKSTK